MKIPDLTAKAHFMLFLKQAHCKAETLKPLNHYKYHSHVVAATIPSPTLDGRDNQPLKPADGAITFAESSVPSITCPGKKEKKLSEGRP